MSDNIKNKLDATVDEVVDYLKYLAEPQSCVLSRPVTEPEVSKDSKEYAIFFSENNIRILDVVNTPQNTDKINNNSDVNSIFDENDKYFYSLLNDIVVHKSNDSWKETITSILTSAYKHKELNGPGKSFIEKELELGLYSSAAYLQRVIDECVINNSNVGFYLKIELMKYVIEAIDQAFFHQVLAQYYPDQSDRSCL